MRAWIETDVKDERLNRGRKSHAVCVRGLKPPLRSMRDEIESVARRVRAWIETGNQNSNECFIWSHAVCVRGLKQENQTTVCLS